MIAPARKRALKDLVPAWHRGFLELLPRIERYAKAAFRNLPDERRADLIEEAIVNALIAYVRLFELGKENLAYASVLARYAVAQIHDGRRVGSKMNVHDVGSPYAQARKHHVVERLDRYDRAADQWIEPVVADHHTPVADQAAFRLDFPRWLATLNRRDRRIAQLLAAGHKTGAVAERVGLSPGRISQLRRKYLASWRQFHADTRRAMRQGNA